MRKFGSVATALAASLALGACGSHSGASTTTAASHVKAISRAKAVPSGCAPGKSAMGCSLVPRLSLPKAGQQFAVSGPYFPDVSAWQGAVNWNLAKSHITGAVVKASEDGFGVDSQFTRNVQQLKALGIRWAAYDFVRNCSAALYINTLRSVGGPTSGPPVLDVEVPSAKGCAVTLAQQVHGAFNKWPVIYTSPGSWPGGASGNLDVWVAAYGPSAPPCVFTCNVAVPGVQSIRAWQFTDGKFGSPVFIPGIGASDVSRDFNLWAQPAPPPPPPPPDKQAFNSGFNAWWSAKHKFAKQKPSWLWGVQSAH